MVKHATHSEEIEETIELAVKTARGDVRSFLVDRLKQWKKPWEAMTESEQRAAVAESNHAAENLIRTLAALIASEGRKTLIGNLDQVTVKDGLKAVIKMSKHDENRHELMDAQGLAVIVVVQGVEEMLGERVDAKDPVNPDQKDLVSSIQGKWTKQDEAEMKASKSKAKSKGKLSDGFNDE